MNRMVYPSYRGRISMYSTAARLRVAVCDTTVSMLAIYNLRWAGKKRKITAKKTDKCHSLRPTNPRRNYARKYKKTVGTIVATVRGVGPPLGAFSCSGPGSLARVTPLFLS